MARDAGAGTCARGLVILIEYKLYLEKICVITVSIGKDSYCKCVLVYVVLTFRFRVIASRQRQRRAQKTSTNGK